MYLWTRKNRLNFGRHPPSDPDDRGFNCISGESDSIFIKISSQMYPWTRKSPLNYGSNPNPESGYGLRIQTRISLAEVCGLTLVALAFEKQKAAVLTAAEPQCISGGRVSIL